MIEGIIYILKNDSTVQSLVGQNKAEAKYKIYPVRAADPETHPYITVWITGKTPYECKGITATTYKLSFEVHSYANSYDVVQSMDEAVKDALDGSAGTYQMYVFQEIQFKNTKDMFSDYAGGLYVRVANFETLVNEDQAT
jgi:hypothetical protein